MKVGVLYMSCELKQRPVDEWGSRIPQSEIRQRVEQFAKAVGVFSSQIKLNSTGEPELKPKERQKGLTESPVKR